MTEKLEIYKCNTCGNVVQVLLSGVGELVCCGKPMELLHPKYEEGNDLAEKHVPQVEVSETDKFVRLKSHPMIPEHYIQFIEVYSKDKSCLHLKYLMPNDIAEFDVSFMDKEFEALELCNIHGLWKGAVNND